MLQKYRSYEAISKRSGKTVREHETKIDLPQEDRCVKVHLQTGILNVFSKFLFKLFGETRTFDHIIEDTEELCVKVGNELRDLDKDEDSERVEELERALKYDDDRIEYFLNKSKRKPHSFKVVRSHRHRVRVREMLDSLNHNSDSEDEE